MWGNQTSKTLEWNMWSYLVVRVTHVERQTLTQALILRQILILTLTLRLTVRLKVRIYIYGSHSSETS